MKLGLLTLYREVAENLIPEKQYEYMIRHHHNHSSSSIKKTTPVSPATFVWPKYSIINPHLLF